MANTEHDPMCGVNPCSCKLVRAIRKDTLNTLYWWVDEESRKHAERGDYKAATSYWTARTVIGEYRKRK